MKNSRHLLSASLFVGLLLIDQLPSTNANVFANHQRSYAGPAIKFTVKSLVGKCIPGHEKCKPLNAFAVGSFPRGGAAVETAILNSEQASVGAVSKSTNGAMSLLPRLANWIGDSGARCWVVLFAAILVEIKATTLTKAASDEKDSTKLIISLGMYLVSLLLFAASLAKIEVSVAYAVWSGMGTALVSVAGITMFGESCDAIKVISLSLIMLGVIGLNIRESSH
jgi:small multidrug resistance pump